MKQSLFYMMFILAISCKSEIKNEDANATFKAVLELIINDDYNSIKEMFSDRTIDMIRDGMLEVQLDKAKGLINSYNHESIALSKGSYSAETIFGEVEYVNAKLITDSVYFNQKYFQSLIEFKFVDEGGKLKILSLNVLDANETVVLQKHLDKINKDLECESNCPFNHVSSKNSEHKPITIPTVNSKSEADQVLELAIQLLTNKNYDSTIVVLKPLLRQSYIPIDSVIYIMSQAYLGKDDFIIAKYLMDDAISIDSTKSKYFAERGYCLLQMKQKESACFELYHAIHVLKDKSKATLKLYEENCNN